jgi:hypothetical protein
MSIQTLQLTGHAIQGLSRFSVVPRVSRQLSGVFGRAIRTGEPPEWGRSS